MVQAMTFWAWVIGIVLGIMLWVWGVVFTAMYSDWKVESDIVWAALNCLWPVTLPAWILRDALRKRKDR